MSFFGKYGRKPTAARVAVSLRSENELEPLAEAPAEGDDIIDLGDAPEAETTGVDETVPTDDILPAAEPEVEADLEAIPSEEPTPADPETAEAPPVADPFVEQRGGVFRTHAMIRNRRVLTAEAESAPEAVPAEGELETPVETVPEGETLPEEPALDVTAEGEEIVPVEFVEEEIALAPESEETDVVDTEAPAEELLEDEVDEADSDLAELEARMEQLAGSMIAIESYGIGPSSAAIMQITGLLDGTALETLGLEAFGIETPESAESQMAIEALGEQLREKTSQWGAKILSVVKVGSEKVMGVLSPLWDKITGLVSKLSTATWDKAKAAGAVVKAHPYKTIIGVIGAIAAVAAIVVFAGTGLPAAGTKLPQFSSFIGSLAEKINKINWPFGKISATVAKGGTTIMTSIKNTGGAAKAVAMDSLGWTRSMVTSAGGQLGRAWSTFKGGAKTFGARIGKIAGVTLDKYGEAFEVAQDAGMAAAKSVYAGAKRMTGGNRVVAGVAATWTFYAFLNGFYKAVTSIIKLMIGIVAFGFRVIYGTLSALVRGVQAVVA